ncbi:hypothetical protein [Euzebya tangerina]|uniref:hypothetical protein n=1 Tax=Euzebya tangerina TaxID=591198 RepID=UPI000E317ACE|nr:hypothetical protein [Euzebya tangerina]
MHPILSEARARTIMAERHEEARRYRIPGRRPRPSMTLRAGALMITLGTRLEQSGRRVVRRAQFGPAARQPCGP